MGSAMLLPVHLQQDNEPPQRSGPPSSSGDSLPSLLAIASVVLNIPWVGSFGYYWWQVATWAKSPPGEALFPAILGWAFLGPLAGVCGLASFLSIRRASGKLRGHWAACLGMLLAVSFPILAVALGIIK